MSADSSLTTSAISDEDIANYLRQHKDFFVDKPALLADLVLPHQPGEGAISLVERQVSVLRERNTDMHHRLSTLLTNARNNDKLFEKTKRLILSLLDAQDINDVVDAVLYSFNNDFTIEHTVLILFAEQVDESALSAKGNVQVLPSSTAHQVLGTIISNNQAVCGCLDTEEQQLLFRDEADNIGSTAITPLNNGQALGLLAIGNTDPDYYRSSMSTLFLSYIGDVLGRLLPQHINK